MTSLASRRGRPRRFFPRTNVTYQTGSATVCQVTTQDPNLVADLWARILPRYNLGQPTPADPVPKFVPFVYWSDHSSAWADKPLTLPWKRKQASQKYRAEPHLPVPRSGPLDAFHLPVSYLPLLRTVIGEKEDLLIEELASLVPAPVPAAGTHGAHSPSRAAFRDAIIEHPRGLIEYVDDEDYFVMLHWLGELFRGQDVLVVAGKADPLAPHLAGWLNEFDLDYHVTSPRTSRPPPPKTDPVRRITVGIGTRWTIGYLGQSLLLFADGRSARANSDWRARALARGSNRCYALIKSFRSLTAEKASGLLGVFGDVIYSTDETLPQHRPSLRGDREDERAVEHAPCVNS